MCCMCAYPGHERVRELPDEPTDVQPGSESKIVELERRFVAGLALHHPEDHNLLDRRRA